jgi:NADPH:quinone reductase-like Zn-dependent oxidoreductase
MAAATALQGLRDFGRIEAGQKVLINGASGGVGTFAVQLAKFYGTEVTAVCSTSKMEMARSLGAEHVIDYTREDFTQNGQQYDLIFAANGNRSLSDYERSLTPTGTFVVAGGAMSQLFQTMLLGPMKSRSGGKTFHSFTAKPSQTDLAFLAELIEAGDVTPVIDRRFPLDETPHAMRYLEEGHAGGKIVITVVDDGASAQSSRKSE